MRSKNVHECSVVTSHNNSAHSAAGADKVELRPVKDESVLFMATVQKLNPTDLSKDISLLSLSIVTLLPTSGGKNPYDGNVSFPFLFRLFCFLVWYEHHSFMRLLVWKNNLLVLFSLTVRLKLEQNQSKVLVPWCFYEHKPYQKKYIYIHRYIYCIYIYQ